mgnify:CR=1 FL=1
MMKHILGIAIALAFLFPAADGVLAQAKKLSVLDHYLALPDDCAGGPVRFQGIRPKFIEKFKMVGISLPQEIFDPNWVVEV